MRIVKKMLYYLNSIAWFFLSFFTKRRFEGGTSVFYRYGSEIFCNGKGLFEKVAQRYKKVVDAYLKNQTEFTIEDFSCLLYRKRQDDF